MEAVIAAFIAAAASIACQLIIARSGAKENKKSQEATERLINGVLALKYLLMLAKKKGMHNINLDKNDIFGAGTQKAMNNILKNHSYSQNGIAGKKFIDLIGNELLK